MFNLLEMLQLTCIYLYIYLYCSLLYVLDCVDVRERECSAENIDMNVPRPSQVGMSYIR